MTTPDFDAMDRMLIAMRVAYEIGDDKRARNMAYLLKIGLRDILPDDQPKTSRAVHSAGDSGNQSGET
jgi:hypothetical protein